ncbi:hypothetical protein [Rhodococcus wratislaviensis]|uniref:Phasin domain-containing protein n=1 Tax=Rhodococcus wratislaviensis NBRC 100605 TaxID=1219028 RepID=X0RGX5_RHOWR|nr:hypothetical protein [Rhodococcus wratislaviensis]GAF50325.1 hypothetical protein RW1_094_03670 [Rhodococcus wratislaviensis NBRC 100605]
MTTPTSSTKAADSKASGASASRAADAGNDRDQNAFVSIGLKVVDTTKKAGNRSLDAFEKALDSSLECHTAIAAASNVEWVSTIADAQAKLAREIGTTTTAAARQLLK